MSRYECKVYEFARVCVCVDALKVVDWSDTKWTYLLRCYLETVICEAVAADARVSIFSIPIHIHILSNSWWFLLKNPRQHSIAGTILLCSIEIPLNERYQLFILPSINRSWFEILRKLQSKTWKLEAWNTEIGRPNAEHIDVHRKYPGEIDFCFFLQYKDELTMNSIHII